MATWKKVVVSGSNISQLNNDSGYLTTGSLVTPNSFSTASLNGVNLLANSPSGALNFASSSGQGLTISANATNDTLTFGLASIPNNSLANSTITIAGNSTSLGGSITAATILSGTGTVSGSAQVIALLPAGTVSGSSQVLNGTTIHSGSFFNGITVVSGSSQIAFNGITGVPAGLVSGSSQISYSSITGIPANIVSSSVLSSPGQGQALLTTNGVAGSTIDLGLESGDSPTFAGVTAGNVTVGVSSDNIITTSTGDLTVTSAGGNVTISNNLLVTNNLTVQGTASFQNTTNLEVADRFILLASGSNTAGDGGIVIQQGTQNIGELFAFDSTLTRWGLTGSFSANQSTYTPDAFMAAVTTLASTNPNSSGPAGRYSVVGNIFVSSGDDSIWIYS